jgi:hypothetical protein
MLCARKIRTVVSNNDYIMIFEQGDMTRPLAILSDIDAKIFIEELKYALDSKMQGE